MRAAMRRPPRHEFSCLAGFREMTEGLRWRLAASAAVSTAGVGTSLLFVFLCKKLIDIATGKADGNPAWHSVALVLAMAANTGLSILRTALYARNEITLKNRIRLSVFSRLICTYHGSKNEKHTGDIVNRLEEDVRVISETLSGTVPSLFSTLFQFVAAFIFLLVLSPSLAWSVVWIMPAALVFGKFFFRKMRRMTNDIRETDSKVQAHMQENLQHAMLIQTLGQGNRVSSGLSRLQSGLFEKFMRRTRFTLVSRTAVSLAFAAGYAAAFLWGVNGIMSGTVTFGMMTAFLQLVGQIQRPAVDLSSQIPALVHAAASADRLFELVRDSRTEDNNDMLLSSPAGIRLENVSFTYPDGTSKTIDGFSYDFTPGSRTAITGATGVGKSTLVHLMLALLQPQEGKITLYDSEKEVAAGNATRCNLVYVPQGNSLLSGTIMENLLLGNPEATQDQIRKALGIAEALFVYDLPEGLETRCAEAGNGLSEGQAQRIAIARALLRKGGILLMDEFSSALDPGTEHRLMKNLTSSLPDKTMIFITHHEGICEYCDKRIKIDPQTWTAKPFPSSSS